MEKNMKNSVDNIWQKTNDIFHQTKGEVLLLSLVMWASVGLMMLFPLFGFSLAFFVMAFSCIGFKRGVIDCLSGKKIKVESVFMYYKHCISAFCLKVCTLLLIGLWSLLFIVPGIVAGVNYAFAPYIFADNPKLGTIECLKESKKLIYGKRLEIFLIYLMEVFFVLITHLIFSCFMIILKYFANIPIWMGIVLPIVVALIMFFVFIYPYFEMIIASFYLDASNEVKQKKLRQNAKKVDIAQ